MPRSSQSIAGTCRASAHQSKRPCGLPVRTAHRDRYRADPAKKRPVRTRAEVPFGGQMCTCGLRYASIAATFLSLANEARSSSDSAKHTRREKSKSTSNKHRHPCPVVPAQHSTAASPCELHCIARCTCNPHCIQPLVRQRLYLRPGIVPGLTRRPQPRPCSTPCYAMPCHARHAPLPPTFPSEWGPAKRHRNSHCNLVLRIWNPREQPKAHRTRSAAAGSETPAGQHPGRPNKYREPQASLPLCTESDHCQYHTTPAAQS